MHEYDTEQERFWAGQFGEDYLERNRQDWLVACNTALFSRILARVGPIGSIAEFGANIGLNLLALRHLLPSVPLTAIEINQTAAVELSRIEAVTVHTKSIFADLPTISADFVFTKGLLIHIDPNRVNEAYEILYQSSNRYICIVEYYNPTPIAVSYRGHENRLFKRDFAGEMLTRHAELHLLDYGFVYHLDRHPQDDVTWFLMEKRPPLRPLDDK